ncbi:hypothetical protein GA0061083_1436 [Pseudarthrobacter enclensis]|uniref:hypothetical protein n=1 Tax=Pseudarthrobacter enclensis TaxID=993070 RepID=UPI000815E426|nr:hypothetical protein [Pseudarthrobacter enclensis]SCB90681.1 hypothetical protein GA0061083_1436 [Pseudarthrobacter enclensis]
MATTTRPTNLHPVLNWCQLSRTEEVTVYRQNQTITTGHVDMVALDGTVFWIIETDGYSRTMIHRNDEPMVYRKRLA